MNTRISIIAGPVSIEAELADTPCAKAVAGALPVSAGMNEWGDEFYFEVPVHFPLDETATRDVKVGDIGFWPPGNAIAVFFGPTPLSRDSKPVPASEVNIIGKITGDAALLKKAKGASTIRFEPAAQ